MISDGYIHVSLNDNETKRKYQKHRLIAEHFLPNPLNLPCIDLFNHNKADNCLVNLRWVSCTKNIISDGNKELYEYILSWFSFILQKPSGKTGVAMVITGSQGTGKNVFTNVLCKLLGVYANPNVNVIENIVGKFNTNLENKKLIIWNELTSSDANKYLDSDRLKSVLTEDRVEVNQMCIAIRSIEIECN